MKDKVEISNDAHLGELISVVKNIDNNIDRHLIEWQIQELPVFTKNRLAREYNEIEHPNMIQSQIIAAMMRDERKRVYEPKDAKEVANALEKCATVYAENSASDRDKWELGRKLKHFVIGHPENTAQVFDTLTNHLTDVDVIEPIRSCMSRDHSLLEKGFAAIHKSADAVCAKAKQAGKEEPQYAASEQLRLAFADLYNFNGQLDSAETIDKVTSYFPSFDKQIRRINPEGYRFVGGNLEGACNLWQEHAKSELIYRKMQILRETFHEFEESKKPFTEIYAATSAKYKDDLERLEFQEKVKQKIIGKSHDITSEDMKVLDKVSKESDYNAMKVAGNTDINKILMSARRDVRKNHE